MENFLQLYRFEIKKIVSRKITLAVVVGMILMLGWSGINFIVVDKVEAGGKEISAYEDMVERRKYARELNGRLMDDKLIKEMQAAYKKSEVQKGNQDYCQYEAVYQCIAEVQGDEAALYEDAESYYKIGHIFIESIMKDAQLTDREMTYWQDMEKRIQSPFIFQYMEGAGIVFAAFNILGMLLVFVVAFSLSDVFSGEYRNRTDQLIFCSKHGKRRLYYAKIAAGITVGLSSAVLLFVFFLLLTLSIYGSDGMGAQLQLAAISPYPLTIGQGILILFALYVLAALLFSVFAMFSSELFRSSVAVMAVMVFGILLSLVIHIPDRWRVLSQLWHLLPSQVVTPEVFHEYRLLPWLGGYLNVLQTVPLFYAFLIIGLIVVGRCFFKNYKK